MKAIETKLLVLADGTVKVETSEKLAPGEHSGLFVETEASRPDRRHPIRLPLHQRSPWPEGFRVSRDQIYGEE
jgi:hypothetical protein